MRSQRENCLWVALFGALILLRMPEVLVTPRFFAEEGPVFFSYAWHMSTWQALGQVYGGYLNLACNVVTWLDVKLVKAGIVSLEDAPIVTEAAGFGFPLLPAILLLWGRADWLRKLWVVPMCLLSIALVPRGAEVWLESLHIQFHLALATALMLVTEAEECGVLCWLRRFILVLGPLSGPAPILFLPLYAVRTWVEKKPARTKEFALFALAAMVQIGFFSGLTAGRHVGTATPALLLNALLSRQVVDLLFYWPISQQFSSALVTFYNTGDWRFYGLAILSACIFGSLAVLALRGWRHPAAWLYAAVILSAVGGAVSIPVAFVILSPHMNIRYSFVSNALVLVSLVAVLAEAVFLRAYRLACVVFLFWFTVLFYAVCTPSGLPPGANWREEVSTWRRDPHYHLRIWSYKGLEDWFFDLSPDTRH